MRLKSFKGLSLGKMKEKEEESGIVIEGTTAEQLAEMQKKLDSRKQELEDATKQLRGLSSSEQTEEVEEEAIGPHGPIQELTIEDIPDDDEDLFATLPVDVEDLEIDESRLQETTPDAVKAQSTEGNEPASTVDLLEDTMLDDGDEEEEEEKKPDSDGLDLSDSFDNLFDEEEDDENPLIALINNLPEVSTQELLDDIEDVKQIIKEWQHNKQYL